MGFSSHTPAEDDEDRKVSLPRSSFLSSSKICGKEETVLLFVVPTNSINLIKSLVNILRTISELRTGSIVNSILSLFTFFFLITSPSVSAIPHHTSSINDHRGSRVPAANTDRAGRTTASGNLNNGNGNGSKEDGVQGGQSAAMILRPEHFTVPCGAVVHLFPRYGYFSLSMRVVSRGEKVNGTSPSPPSPIRNDSWIFLEPVNNVIEPSTFKVQESTFSSNENGSLPFHNLFHFDLCEDVNKLMVAYFKNFSIEGLDKPWQAFSGGWRVPSVAKYFGVEQTHIEGDFRFILVKIFLVRGTGTVVPLPNVTASHLYKPYFERFKPSNDLSTYEFFKIVGTHYVHSYVTGNALYQVLVYDPDGFQSVLKHLFYEGVKDQTNNGEYLQKLPDVLTKYVKYYGRIFVLNSSPEVTDNVRNALMTHPLGPYSAPMPSLIKLHNNSELVAKIEAMLAKEPYGILGIDLRGIDFLFEDPEKKAGFQEALKHKMQLWEVNFTY